MCYKMSESNTNVNVEKSEIDSLQNEVEFYRQNQMVVEQEIRNLINDNQKLSQQVRILLKEKLDTCRKLQDRDGDKVTETMSNKVTLITKERDSLHVLWQTSQKTIEALETELKAYHGYNRHSNQNNSTESRKDLELKVETALTDYLEIENKYKELDTRNRTLENEIKNKETEIANLKENLEEFDKIKKKLEETNTLLAAERKSNEDLKSQLMLSQKEIVNYVKKEAEAKSKVAEALQLFDFVSIQKEEAFRKITETTEEMTQLRITLTNIKKEMEHQHNKELEEVKEKFNEKITDMLKHIQNLDAELVEKGLLLNKTLRDNKVLQNANDNNIKEQNDNLAAMDPKLAAAEQRLQAMFQELVGSERRNIQLLSEKQCIALDIKRMQDTTARQNKRRDWEESLLKSENDELRLQIEHLQKSLSETHEMVTKLQSMLFSKTELNQKMVSSKENELIELNKHLKNQMELNKKWKETYIEMTEKLKNRFQELQKENSILRNQLQSDQTSLESNDNT